MTWRVRRIGRTFWSSIRTRSRPSWIAIELARRTAAAGRPNEHERQAASSRSIGLDEPFVTSDGHHWLAALRLDRAACAVREPD
jgi:hypothetical protein